MRRRKYLSAAKSYRKANDLGYSLLDHEVNHLRSELKSNNFIKAYSIVANSKNVQENEKNLDLFINNLSKFPDSSKINILDELSQNYTLPQNLLALLPWSSKDFFSYTNNSDNQDFAVLKSKTLNESQNNREFARIKSSGAYIILSHLSSSLRNPLKIITLPLSTPLLILNLILKRKGLRSNTNIMFPTDEYNEIRNSVVFFPTNGVGFGHFTRLLAVAIRLKKISPKTDIVFFTTMPTLNILTKYGFTCYHLPGRYRYDSMSPKIWNSICEEMLQLIFQIHRPKAFIFDGAYPYRGMINSLNSFPRNLLKIWIKRGSIKSNSKSIPVDSIKSFHVIIRPGDSVKDNFIDELDNDLPIIRTNPILLLEKSDMLPKYELRNRFGIPRESVLCYLQLGAGNINDIDSEISLSLSSLLSFPENYVLIGESMIGEKIVYSHPRVRIISDFPNSKYFNDIDFALVAGGYNTYHEIIEARIPSICFPNLKTGRDDQLARINLAGEKGCMIIVKKRNKLNIDLAISRIMDVDVRNDMASRMSKLSRKNGALDTAKWIYDQIKD